MPSSFVYLCLFINNTIHDFLPTFSLIVLFFPMAYFLLSPHPLSTSLYCHAKFLILNSMISGYGLVFRNWIPEMGQGPYNLSDASEQSTGPRISFILKWLSYLHFVVLSIFISWLSHTVIYLTVPSLFIYLFFFYFFFPHKFTHLDVTKSYYPRSTRV